MPLLLAAAAELEKFLKVMSGAPSDVAFGSLIERLEIAMSPLLEDIDG